MARRILIVKLSSMGDVIHTLPAAQALRRRFPQARLAWVVEKAHAGVLRGQPFLDELIEFDRGTVRASLDLVRRLRKQSWDLAIDFQGLARSALVTRLSGAKRRLGFAPGRECSHVFYNEHVATPTTPIHAVDRAMLLLEPLGATFEGLPLGRRYLAKDDNSCGCIPAVLTPVQLELGEKAGCCGYSPAAKDLFPLPLGDAERSAVDSFLQESNVDLGRERLVVLNPHCRNPANIWPTAHFASLAERLLEHRELKVAVTGGPVAKPMCDLIAAHNGGRVLRADGRFSILGSAELIRRASVFVTGDTGPMHIAAAVGAPIVALLGPTMPMKTGPYATDAVVLRKQLHCSPCLARQCPLILDPPPCMDEITVDTVYAATLARLAETSSTDVQRKSA